MYLINQSFFNLASIEIFCTDVYHIETKIRLNQKIMKILYENL